MKREYGITDSIKLASNENPLGPSPKAVNAIRSALTELNRYPDGSGRDLIKKLAEKFHLSPENIIIGNGSDDIIGMLATTFLQPGDEAILPKPSFLMYEIAVRTADAVPVFVPVTDLSIDLDKMQKHVSDKTRMVFICNPNNPTGTVVSEDQLEIFLRNIPQDIVVVVDEAYIEFNRYEKCISAVKFLDRGSPVVTLRTFSKGLRTGRLEGGVWIDGRGSRPDVKPCQTTL